MLICSLPPDLARSINFLVIWAGCGVIKVCLCADETFWGMLEFLPQIPLITTFFFFFFKSTVHIAVTSWVVQLTCYGERMLSRGIWTVLRDGSTHKYSLSGDALRTALRRRIWKCQLMKARYEPAMCTCSPEVQSYPGLHQEKHDRVEGGDSAPVFCSHEILSGVQHPVLGVPTQEGHWAVGAGPEEGWSTSPMRTGWRSWGLAAWRREESEETL